MGASRSPRRGALIDAWTDEHGSVVLHASWIAPRRLARLRSVQRSSGEVRIKQCVIVGNSIVVQPGGAVHAAWFGWRHRKDKAYVA